MSYLVIDLETTDKEEHKRKGNPFFNEVLCVGYKNKDLHIGNIQYTLDHIHKYKVLIGHNIKYDLLYLWRDPQLQNYLRSGGEIWDTQLVEYMLSAQQHKYPALRDIAVNKYGCKERIKYIERGYESGLNTSEIDIQLLLKDVKNDVLDTEQVALQQVKKVKDAGMYNLVKGEMDSLLATTEMEYNGMYVNVDILNRNKYALENEIISNSENIYATVKTVFNTLDTIHFNINSNDHLSILLFGGVLKIEEKIPDGVYKTGKKKGEIKFKIDRKLIETKGLGIKPQKEWRLKKEGFYSTNEAVLKQINHRVAKLILKNRELQKEISTYYDATLELVHSFDSCVHPQLCHCGYDKDNGEFGGGTATGRLSSRYPNIQNQPRAPASKVKQHFTSRYKNGKIIEFDYKMLEVVVFAYLTQDQKLIEDINKGLDIYKETATKVYNILLKDVTKEQRQNIKRTVLALIYGAGAKKIAMTLGIDVEEAQTIINTFYKRYPKTKVWQEQLVRQVNNNKGLYISCTGRRCQFELRDAPDFLKEKGILKTYNPADIKNYPVQGLATADIVLIMIGIVFREAINHRDKFLMVNTVHDSLILDCRPEHVTFAINLVQNELRSVYLMMKTLFNLDFNVNIDVDVKVGDSWYDCALE